MVTSKRPVSDLRIGRYSNRDRYYYLTTSTLNRRQIFADPEHAFVVLDAIRWLHDSGEFRIDAAVVMPDRLHIVGKLGDCSLAQIIHRLKSETAKTLDQSGMTAPFWQSGYFDHAIRSYEEFLARVCYTVESPRRANLVERAEDYPYAILPIGWVRRKPRPEHGSTSRIGSWLLASS